MHMHTPTVKFKNDCLTTLDLTFRLTLLWNCFQSIIGWLEFNRNHFRCAFVFYIGYTDSHTVWPQVLRLTMHTYTKHLYLDFRHTIHFPLLFHWGSPSPLSSMYFIHCSFNFNTIQNGLKWTHWKRQKLIHAHKVRNIKRMDGRTWNIWFYTCIWKLM